MRNIFSFVAVSVMLICILGSCRRFNRIGDIASDSHTVLISKSNYPASAIQQVIATTAAGNIEVVGDATDQATLEVYGSARSRDSVEITEKVKEFYDLSIERDNNKLTVTATQKKNFKNGLFNNNSGVGVHFVLHVSKAVGNTLKTSGGNISLQTLSGDQSLTTSGGNIRLSNIQGPENTVQGNTSGGNISIEHIDIKSLNLKTSGGNIDANHINGNVVLETSGGNISVDSGKGTYSLTTSGGNVRATDLQGPLKMYTSGGNLDATNIVGGLTGSTSGGSVNAKFASVNSDIDLDNSGGNINIYIPKDSKVNIAIASENVKVENLVNFSGKSDKQSIEGTLNGGGPTIKGKSSGGTVYLNLE